MQPSEQAERRFLLVETSGRIGKVALASGQTILHRQQFDESRKHARDIAPAVAGGLRTLGWRAADLDAIAVSRGPGSYTGLRVGITSAKTLAYGISRPIVALDTFLLIALQAPVTAPFVDVLGDAQQGALYVQRFRPGGGLLSFESAGDLKIMQYEDWLRTLSDDVWVTGPGLVSYTERLPKACRLAPESAREPCLETLLRAALFRDAQGSWDDLWRLEPVYLRPSSAESKWSRKSQD